MDGFTVTKQGTSAKADVPRRYLRKRVYVIITKSDATGDGTGYSMTVKKNYESHAQHLKDMAKENPEFGEDQKVTRNDCLLIHSPQWILIPGCT